MYIYQHNLLFYCSSNFQNSATNTNVHILLCVNVYLCKSANHSLRNAVAVQIKSHQPLFSSSTDVP